MSCTGLKKKSRDTITTRRQKGRDSSNNSPVSKPKKPPSRRILSACRRELKSSNYRLDMMITTKISEVNLANIYTNSSIITYYQLLLLYSLSDFSTYRLLICLFCRFQLLVQRLDSVPIAKTFLRFGSGCYPTRVVFINPWVFGVLWHRTSLLIVLVILYLW